MNAAPRTSESKTRTRPATTLRRRQILDAALRAFIQQGFDATTIEQIRESSGASHGSIYHHFGSKEAIALALYVEGMRDYYEGMQKLLNGQADLERGVRGILRFHLAWSAADKDRALYLTRAGMAEVSRPISDRIAEVNQDFLHFVSQWIEPFAERGEVVRIPADMYASLVLGPASHFCRHWLVGRVELDVELATNVFAKGALKSLTNSD